MQRMTHQVVDQHSAAADAASLLAKARQFRRFQVMGEEGATYEVEAVVPKRKRERVSHERAMPARPTSVGALH